MSPHYSVTTNWQTPVSPTQNNVTQAAGSKSSQKSIQEEINGLSKSTYSTYSEKARAHAGLIERVLQSGDGNNERAISDLKKFYDEYPYLKSQVSQHLSSEHMEKIFGSTEKFEFETKLYNELLASPLSYERWTVIDAKIDNSNNPNQSNKARYLEQIKTNGMLGYYELQPLANLIGRQIVVVREEKCGDKEPNNVELIVNPTADNTTSQSDPVYVQVQRNYHFKTFSPHSGQRIQTGVSLTGTATEGSSETAGLNDCLIASIRRGGGDFKGLSNQQIRNHCAEYVKDNVDDALFDLEHEMTTKKITTFKSSKEILSDYVGVAIINQGNDTYFQGEYNNGPVGVWDGITPDGKFEFTFIDKELFSTHRVGTRDASGAISLLNKKELISTETLMRYNWVSRG